MRCPVLVLRLALVVLVGAGLSACTGSSGGDGPKAVPSTRVSGGSADPAAEVNRRYLSAVPSSSLTAIAAVRGRVVGSGAVKVPGTAELIAVQAGPNSTAVRWRMATDADDVVPLTSAYSDPARPIPDISSVTLVAKQADLVLKSGRWGNRDATSGECTCAWSPRVLGPDGVEMSILFQALPASVTEIELHVPGFPTLTGPVTRS